MSQKNTNKFYCKRCDYTSRNKYDYNKHLSTAKHNNKKGNPKVTPIMCGSVLRTPKLKPE